MGVQLPYAVELQVARHRLHATLKLHCGNV